MRVAKLFSKDILEKKINGFDKEVTARIHKEIAMRNFEIS